jgi:hypothetical protein
MRCRALPREREDSCFKDVAVGTREGSLKRTPKIAGVVQRHWRVWELEKRGHVKGLKLKWLLELSR